MKIPVPVITIDGLSGVGKGTLCKKLSKILKWNILDSGALYRTFVLFVLKNKIPLNQEIELVRFANLFGKNFYFRSEAFNSFFKDRNTLFSIRKEFIGYFASKIFMFPNVRKEFLSIQYSFRKFPGLIADGRDMGTIVFPDAHIKIFLYASLKERVQRRMLQMKKMGIHHNFNFLFSRMKMRDEIDCTRQISPTNPADDAFIIDSTFLNQNEVVKKVLNYIRNLNFYKKNLLNTKKT